MKTFVPILINNLPAGARNDESDVLDQALAVKEALQKLHFRTRIVTYGDPGDGLFALHGDERPAAVFNLVETVNGRNQLQYLAPRTLERKGIPFTGNSSEALRTTTDKILAKETMARRGIRTPWWTVPGRPQPAPGTGPDAVPRAVIFKPVEEDASVGVREDLIGVYTEREAADVAASLQAASGMRYMAEEYIDGREFNISLIEAGGAPSVFPAVEQDFSRLPPGYPRVVGYRAKWEPGTIEFGSIPRKYHFSSGDRLVLETIRDLAVQCWNTFGLSGYARVDFRVDDNGTPYVLEVNANPCLSPDAGFAFAGSLSGLTMTDLVRLILDSAFRRSTAWRRASAR